jgi:hypothetical protein
MSIRYQLGPHVSLSRTPDDQAVLVNERSGKLYALNRTAMAVLTAMQADDGDIKEAIDSLDAPNHGDAEEWTRNLLRELQRHHLLQEVKS